MFIIDWCSLYRFSISEEQKSRKENLIEGIPLTLTHCTPLCQNGWPCFTVLLVSSSLVQIYLHGKIGISMCRGDSDLILDGIHENVLRLNYHDPLMQKTVNIYQTQLISLDSFTYSFESFRILF